MANYTSASLTCTISSFSVDSVSIINGGSGYQQPYIEFGIPSSGGLQALAEATIDSNGTIISINLISGGSGYLNTPTVKAYDLHGATLPTYSVSGWDTSPLNDATHNYYAVSSYNLYQYFQGYVNNSTYNTDYSNTTASISNLYSTKANLDSPTFTGTVSGITKSMVGLDNVDNTSDVNKPVSTAQKSYVDTSISNLVASAPATLDTLNELASALGNDANFSTTVINSLATKAPIASPTFTGTVSGITKSMVGLGSVDNTSDVDKPISTATQTALNGKQATLVYDTNATSGSTNSMTSGSIYNYVDPIRTGLTSLTNSSLYQKIYGINAGINKISDVLATTSNSQSSAFLLSMGGHSLDTSITYTIPNSAMIGIESAHAQGTSIGGSFTVQQLVSDANPCTRCRFSNIQFTGAFTINGTQGRHYFADCAFTGISVIGATTNWLTFTDCDFTSGTVSFASTFAGYVLFTRCAFNGNPTLSFTANFTTIYAVFRDCTGLSSATITNGVLVGVNFVGATTRLDATALYQNGSQVITTYDSVPTSASTNILRSGGIYTALQNYALTSSLSSYLTSATASSTYQPLLTYDNLPISGSTNLVKSGGIYTALSGKQDTITSTTALSCNSLTVNGVSITANGGNSYTSLTENTSLNTLTVSPSYKLIAGQYISGSTPGSSPLTNTIITANSSTASFSSLQKKFSTYGSAKFVGQSGGFQITSPSTLSSQIPDNTAFTVEMWYYPTQTQGTQGAYQTLFDCGNENAGYMAFFINHEQVSPYSAQAYLAFPSGGVQNGSYRLTLDGGNWVNAGGKNTINQNAWNHIALTYDTTNRYLLLVNGYLVDKDTSASGNYIPSSKWMSSANSPSYSGWTLGCRNNGSPGYDLGINQGYLQHFRVSSTNRYAFSSNPSVGSTYTLPTSAFTSDSSTVYYNSLDQSSGTTLGTSQVVPNTASVNTYANAYINSSADLSVASINSFNLAGTGTSVLQTDASGNITRYTGSLGTTYSFDTNPTSGSSNLLTSGSIYTALSSYLTTASASSTYATISSLSSYLTTSTASSTYATISSLSSYLTTATASSTYQPLLSYDNSPISASTNLVKSGGIYTALSAKQDTITSTSNLTIAGLTSSSISNSGAISTNSLTVNGVSITTNGGGSGSSLTSITENTTTHKTSIGSSGTNYDLQLYGNFYFQNNSSYLFPPSSSGSFGFGYPYTPGLTADGTSTFGPFLKTSAGWIPSATNTIQRTDFALSNSDNSIVSMKLFFAYKFKTGAGSSAQTGYMEILIFKAYGNTTSINTTTALVKGPGNSTWSVSLSTSSDNIVLTFSNINSPFYYAWIAQGVI